MSRCLIGALCLALAAPAGARITEVHLMPDGAEVTQTLQLDGEPLRVSGLPAALDIGQIRLEAEDGLRLRAIDLRVDADAETGGEREALQSELDAVEDRLARLEREDADRALARELLRGLGGDDERRSRLAQTMDDAVATLERLTEAEIEARASRRELEAEREKLQARLDELGAEAEPPQVLRIDPGDATGRLELRYPVQRASFEVAYRLALDSAAAELRLEPRLVVRQSTEQDWENVALSASTTRRSYRLSVPDPRPPVLRPQPEAQADRLRAAEAGVAKASRAADAAVLPQAYDIRYALEETVSIPADNRPRPFALPAITRDVELQARVVPQQEAAAYLIADWTVPEDAAIAAGEAEILRDGVRVGNARLPMLMPGQEHEQGFGTDPSLEVDVVRQPVKRDESFFGGTQRWVQAQTVTVESAHREPVALRMRDAVPVAGDGDISVELEGDAPDARDIDGREGVHEWRSELAPGETQRWQTRVTISAPADMELDP